MGNILDDDPREDLKIKAQDLDASLDDEVDTQGHSMQMLDLARTVSRDRARDAEQAARTARMRDSGAPKSGLRRLFRRGG